MQNKFISSLAFLIFANLLVKPLWLFGIDRTVQNIVGSAEYGSYFAVFNLAFIFHIILDLGINNFNNRAVSRDAERIKTYFPAILQLKILLSLAYFAVVFIVSTLIDYNELLRSLLLFIAINQIMLSFILYFRSNIAALQKFKLDSFFSVLDKFIMIILSAVVIWTNVIDRDMDIFLFVSIQTVSLFVVAIAGLIVNLKLFSLKLAIPDMQFMMRIIRGSYPFAILGILMSVYSRIDAVMIERLLPNGSDETGIYAASYRILDAVNMLPFLFATILLPLYSKMIKRKDDIFRITKLAFGLVLTISVILSVSSILFRKDLILLLYLNATDYWWSVFGVVIAAFIPVSIMYIFGSLLTANANLKTLNIIAASGVVINIILNYFLIRRYGALGAAYATLATECAVVISHIFAARKYLNIPLPGLTMLKAVVLIIFIIIGAKILMETKIEWWISYLLLMFIMLGLAASLKLFHPGDIIRAFGTQVSDTK